MIEISVRELVDATGAHLLAGSPERLCRGCAIDSRQVGPDGIFVAFPGERVDGNAFARPAIEAGAGCVVLTREPEPAAIELARARGCALVAAAEPTEFLLSLAAWYRGRLCATVVGITGSIGKTTTKDLLAGLLAQRYRVHATRGNLNNQIGLPLTLLSAPADAEVLVLEMGMNHPGEIDRLSRCARPDIAVITKIGTSHIGMLGGRAAIARAKSEIMDGMPEGGVLVLSGDDDFTPLIADEALLRRGLVPLICGRGADADVRASDVALDEEGRPSFSLSLPGEEPVAATLPCLGAQSVANAVLAAGVAHELGLAAPEIQAGLAAAHLTGRRQEVRRAACGARVIDDSYNASPESMAAALDLLAQLPCAGRRVAVLGEMGELGEEAPFFHGLVGAYAAARRPDLLVCVGGDDARTMAAAARTMGLPEARVLVEPSTDALISGAVGRDLLGADDVALVKGSRFVGLDRFVEEVCQDVR